MNQLLVAVWKNQVDQDVWVYKPVKEENWMKKFKTSNLSKEWKRKSQDKWIHILIGKEKLG